MSHRIYTTEALVLGNKATGEGSAVLFLLTRDHGLIYATAQSLRSLKSKLRYSVQLFNFCRVSLVRGRETWRLVNAESQSNFCARSTEQLQMFGRLAALLLRLVRGETPHPELFDVCRKVALLLAKDDPKGEELEQIELSAVYNILNSLGYIEKRPIETREQMLEVINQALHHSHL